VDLNWIDMAQDSDSGEFFCIAVIKIVSIKCGEFLD
jgi:hypothetical protein